MRSWSPLFKATWLLPPVDSIARASFDEVVQGAGAAPATHPVVTRDGPVEAASAAGAPPPLGRPLPAATAYVLGPELRPLPAGVPGELFLGGDSLAAGYFRRPELTAERFLPDPFSRAPGARLYRTGDRGRLREDGAIEFLGRADDQVKLRGFRVELG